jgi:serine/threonine protein kinase
VETETPIAVTDAHARAHVDTATQQRNILINDQGRACLVDFGLVAVGEHTRTTAHTRGKVAGVYGWMAPELFGDEEDVPEGHYLRKTMASDVFAFGRVLLAVRT